MSTFSVSQVELGALLPPVDRDEALRRVLQGRVEQLGEGKPLVMCSESHPFAAAAQTAFYDHYPLVISPDGVWFCLAQAFRHHISLNAERLRGRLVPFEGKKDLWVERSFFLGQNNDWPGVFAEFSEQIAKHAGKLRDLVAGDFSTTGPAERIAFDVVVMDAFLPYFNYGVAGGCGIPSITLLGTPDDWRSLRQRASMLGEFELSAWVAALMPVLDQLVETSEGRVDGDFWRSFFRYESTSGGSEITGWMQLLFPYLIRAEKIDGQFQKVLFANPYLDWETRMRAAEKRGSLRWDTFPEGPSLEQLPSGMASVPVTFLDRQTGLEHPLRFVAGMFGVAQDADTRALRPQFGWAVVHAI